MKKVPSRPKQTKPPVLRRRNVIADDERERMPVKEKTTVQLDSQSVEPAEETKLTNTDTSVLAGENGDHSNGGSLPIAEDNALSLTPVQEEKHTIRVVSLERLLRPSLVEATKEANRKATKSPQKTRKSKENISIIEISDDDSDSSLQLNSPRKIVPRKLSLDFMNEDTVSSAPLAAELTNSTPSDTETVRNAEPKVKDCQVVIIKLPEDLTEIKSRFKLKSIYDQHNVEINRFSVSTAQKSKYRREMENTVQTTEVKSKKQEVDTVAEPNEELNSSDSDEPLRNTRSSKNIPKVRKMTRNARKRRAVSDSEDENAEDKLSAAVDDEINGNSDEASNKYSEEEVCSTRNTAAGRSQRAAERSRRTARNGNDEDQPSNEDKEDFQPRKKRTRIRRNSPSSSDDEGSRSKSKKRQRLKKKKSENDSEGESPSKGRKNIRKLLKKSDLEQTTKTAELEEMERKQRIAERQKLYNQVYDEKPEEARTLDQLILDFDEETKEPLLEVDKKLVKQLKPHQANGIKFMFDACFESLERMKDSKGSGCILAHCMGLGKTLQVVTLTHTLLANADITGVERVLVVCPLSTVLNWVNEFKMWMRHVRKGTEVEVYEISKYKDNVSRANKLMEWHNEGGVMIIGYDMFRNLANPTTARIRKKVRESLQTSLIDPGPELIVCDEGHLLKNEKTSLSQMVNRISTMRRIVLTGTPIQNNMKEYYCMVQFVKPKLLGTYLEYLNRFVNPITNGQYTDSTPYDIQLMRKRAHVLHKLLDGCVQRRDYSVLAPFLPPKLEFVLSIKLTPMQSILYKYYMQNFAGRRIDDDLKRSSLLFTDFQNLQRIWTHPRVLRYNSDRYEIAQQKKRFLASESESLGSIKDFLDDDSDESPHTTPESSDASDDEVQLVESGNQSSNGSTGSDKLRTQTTRRTRRNHNIVEEEVEKLENPTEWWMQLCPETELNNLEHSGKLVLLMEILKECETIGDKLLVFSQSLYSLDVIEHFLTLLDENTQKDEEDRDETLSKYPGSWAQGLDYFRLDGSTSIENRNDACKVFNDESNTRARLFLISTRAGGLGINLVAANRVVIFDVSWNPSHDIQSIFRVYRFGQSKPCYIYRLIAMGTMEEKIYERQVTKQAISKRVIDEQQIDRHYKANDLQELYRYDVDNDEPRPTPNVPKDRLFAELLKRFENIVYKYHEHDSLLENKEEETLNEEERKAAWEEFEQEKNRPPLPAYGSMGMGMGMGMSMGMGNMGGMAGRGNMPITSSTIFGFRNDVLLKLLNIKAREDNPTFNDATINAMIPYLMQELTRQMKDGEITLYKSLCDLYYKLEVPAASQTYSMGYAMQGGMGVAPSTGQGVGQQPPMMVGAGPSGNVAYMYADQTGINRAPFATNVQVQEPGISGIPRTLPTASGITPTYVDPNVVELD